MGEQPYFPATMGTQKHAQMADLRAAVRACRVIRFSFRGKEYEVEPHMVGSAPGTGTYTLSAWVRSASDGSPPGWKKFPYWQIRDLRIEPATFAIRPMPKLGHVTMA
jgi:hypothetical protein